MIAPKCQRCGAPLDANLADVFCPACLLQSTLDLTDEDLMPPAPPGLPRAFGPYRLVEEIGRGGMGVVYRAEDPELRRSVAVKLMLAGAHSTETALRRFHREAATAAGLQHPNIVAIHDYGEVDGQPYYAMDLVAGRDLAALCAGRPLPARRAAELLRLLAGAVRYAHERGVVHCDLKPSNVLIDAEGRTRITDFGLAKQLGAPTGATLTGQMLGSPSYASPEQAAGRSAEIGTASDVYGLGALFYHLLTGRAPFNAATPTETLRLVLDTDPPPPRLLNPSLPHDLDTICLKCLAKEPARRYASAAEVEEDIERYLDRRPIRAQPPSALYRLRKFTRRHRIGVAAVLAVFLALVIGLGFALAGFRRALVQERLAREQERLALEQKHAAETARSQAQGLMGFVMKGLEPDMRDHGRLQSQKLTVEAAVRYFDQLPPELRNEATSREHAQALEALADLCGRRPGATTIVAQDPGIARGAAQKALALRKRIAAAHPNDLDATLAVYAAEARLTYNDPDAWLRLDRTFPEHIQKLHALEQRSPKNAAVQRALAVALSDWAYYLAFAFRKPAEARAAATEARERWEHLLADAPDDNDVRIGYARSLVAMAQTLAGTEQSAQAIACGEKALAYATQLLQPDPTNLRLLAVAAETAGWLEWVYQNDSLQRARAAERTARDHYRMLMTLDPAAAEWRLRYARVHNLEINALTAENRWAEARNLAQDVIQALRPAARDQETKHAFAVALGVAALLASQAGDAAAAQSHLDALDEFARACILELPEGSPGRWRERLFWLIEQCDALGALNDPSEIARVAREGLDEIERGLSECPSLRDEFLLYRAAAQASLGFALPEVKRAEAVALLKQSLAGFRELPAGGSLRDRARRTINTAVETSLLIRANDAKGAWMMVNTALAQVEEELKNNPDDLGLHNAAGYAARQLSYLAQEAGDEDRRFEAVLIAKNHVRILVEREPANARWRTRYAWTYDLQVRHFEYVGEFEQERAALKKLAALYESLATNETIVTVVDPFRQDLAIPGEAQTRKSAATQCAFVYRGLAWCAALAGDAAEAQAHLEESSRMETLFSLPEGSLEWHKRNADRSLVAAWIKGILRDWPAVARLAQKSLDEIETVLREWSPDRVPPDSPPEKGSPWLPSNKDLPYLRLLARGLLGVALLRDGKTTEPTVALPEVVSALRNVPISSVTWRWVEAHQLVIETWADWLARSGDTAQARSLLEYAVNMQEALIALPGWNIWPPRHERARLQVQLAAVLDPSNPEDAARRTALLDEATPFILGPKAERWPTVRAKEARAKLEALRAATPTDSVH